MSDLLLDEVPLLTQEKRQIWSQYLQRRVLHLLMLYDQRLFRGQFHMFYAKSTLPRLPLLQFYDRYLKLLLLSNELLDDIMPRIRRQLSLQTQQKTLQEEAPTQGNIDWQRTFTRTINETPDLLPLRFDTSLLQQSLATPANILVVAILLNYRQTLQDTLRDDLHDEMLTEQERQFLVGMDERAERELAAPYVHTLIEDAHNADIETLIDQVSTHLHPGVSPYRDLITWWEQFHDLHIGRAFDQRAFSLISRRSDDKTDAWLYTLWLALEIVHLLHTEHATNSEDIHIESDQLQCTFSWNGRRFRFRYTRQSTAMIGRAFGWQNAPEAHPHYIIERERPLEVRPQDKTIWREPPVIVDAGYYLDGTGQSNTQDAIKKILGEMQLFGARYGALFFPHLPDPPAERQFTTDIKHDDKTYAEEIARDTSIYLYKFTPDMPRDTLQERLRAVLEQAIDHLPERTTPKCHGVMLDAESVNASRSIPPRNNVLCPKPHIGAGVFDLVNDRIHCLKDPRLCHVFGQAIVPPFVVRTSTFNELAQQSSDLRTRSDETLRQAEQVSDEAQAEQLRYHIFLGVGHVVEQYVQMHGNTASLEEQYKDWVFGDYWDNHTRCLAEETRKILLSGAYVWDEYKQATLDDWAAPAVQYCRALESEIKRRLYDYYPDPKLGGFKVPSGHMTLGAVQVIYEYKDKDLSLTNADETNKIKSAKHNWGIFKNIVAASSADIKAFEATLKYMRDAEIANKRNTLAHGGHVPRHIAQTLRETIIGRRNQQGILPWFVENLQPKT